MAANGVLRVDPARLTWQDAHDLAGIFEFTGRTIPRDRWVRDRGDDVAGLEVLG